jgi:hypothetical protein
MPLIDGRMRRQPSSKSPVAVLTGFTTTTRVWATYSPSSMAADPTRPKWVRGDGQERRRKADRF